MTHVTPLVVKAFPVPWAARALHVLPVAAVLVLMAVMPEVQSVVVVAWLDAAVPQGAVVAAAATSLAAAQAHVLQQVKASLA